ncbi:MAG: hypothetical protein WDW38_010045 [Sanguina aurantia]
MVLVYGLPLVAAQLSPPPADTSALYSPTGAKGASVASIIQYATYVLAAIALSVIAGSLAAGELSHPCLHGSGPVTGGVKPTLGSRPPGAPHVEHARLPGGCPRPPSGPSSPLRCAGRKPGRALCACLGLRQLNAFFLMLWGVDILGQFAFHSLVCPVTLVVPSVDSGSIPAFPRPPASSSRTPHRTLPQAPLFNPHNPPTPSPPSSRARCPVPPRLQNPAWVAFPRTTVRAPCSVPAPSTNVASLLIAVAFIIAHIGLLIGLHWQLRLVTSAGESRGDTPPTQYSTANRPTLRSQEDLAAAVRLRQAAAAHRANRLLRQAAGGAPVPLVRMDSALFVLVLQPDYAGPLLLDWSDPDASLKAGFGTATAAAGPPGSGSGFDPGASFTTGYRGGVVVPPSTFNVEAGPGLQQQQQQGRQSGERMQPSQRQLPGSDGGADAVPDHSVSGALQRWRAAIKGEVTSQRLARASMGGLEAAAVVDHQLPDASGTYTSLASFFPDGRQPSETADGLWHTPYDAMKLWSAGEKVRRGKIP